MILRRIWVIFHPRQKICHRHFSLSISVTNFFIHDVLWYELYKLWFHRFFGKQFSEWPWCYWNEHLPWRCLGWDSKVLIQAISKNKVSHLGLNFKLTRNVGFYVASETITQIQYEILKEKNGKYKWEQWRISIGQC